MDSKKGSGHSFLKWLDPFTYVDEFILPRLNPSGNSAVSWAVYLITSFAVALAFYSMLGFLLGTTSPLVVVVSGSMEPTLHRGDVVLLGGVKEASLRAAQAEVPLDSLNGVPYSSFAQTAYERVGHLLSAREIRIQDGATIPVTTEGDIVVYFSHYLQRPIIHRAIARLQAGDGYYLITRGDNKEKNFLLDQECGPVENGVPRFSCIERYPVQLKDVSGRALFVIPWVGYVKLLLVDDLQAILFGCPYAEGCIFP
ncbi:MAG: hypothetical protein HY917_02990 [Candidatus Diapherotrites archaeon]|nr:hypothetical protein [Candidatus Diapherotrites archaeon]